MLIRNYGLFWRRGFIYWGKGSNAGHLKGVPANSTTADPTDFREQQGVYALYDDGFRLLYVGQAGANDQQRLFTRLRNHRSDQLADRWTKFSWFGIRPVNADRSLKSEKQTVKPTIGDVLNHIEAILIAVAEPRNNLQGGRFGEHVNQYLQFRDSEALGPDQMEMVRQLWHAMRVKK